MLSRPCSGLKLVFLCKGSCEFFEVPSIRFHPLQLCDMGSVSPWVYSFSSHFSFCTFQPVTTWDSLPWKQNPLGKIYLEMASVSCPLTPCFHPYWLALMGNAFASKQQSSPPPCKSLRISIVIVGPVPCGPLIVNSPSCLWKNPSEASGEGDITSHGECGSSCHLYINLSSQNSLPALLNL